IGTYPETTLEQARNKASDARKLIADGFSPSIDRRVRRARNIERGQATFQVVAEEWLAHHRGAWSEHHYERNQGLLRRIQLPDLGGLPIPEISESMLLTVLKRPYDSGIKESARRARAVAQQVFAYAKDTHRATHNPARELAGSSVLKKPPMVHYAALKQHQVGPFLRKLKESQLEPITRTALLLMLFTGLRDFALRAARWSEIDLHSATWTVPQERMKSGREHRVPLPRQAVAELKQLALLTRSTPEAFVFASRAKDGFLAENTLRLAMHRLGFKVTAHGFRSLLTDLLNEQGFNADAIERQLDHVEQNKVRASYLRSDFFDERRTMMQWLADWADAQRADKPARRIPVKALQHRRTA